MDTPLEQSPTSIEEQEVANLVQAALSSEISLRKRNPTQADRQQVQLGQTVTQAEEAAFRDLAAGNVTFAGISNLLDANFRLECSREVELILLKSPNATDSELGSMQILTKAAAALLACKEAQDRESVAQYLDTISQQITGGTQLVENGIVGNMLANIGLSVSSDQHSSEIEKKRLVQRQKQARINQQQFERGENYMYLAAALLRDFRN